MAARALLASDSANERNECNTAHAKHRETERENVFKINVALESNIARYTINHNMKFKVFVLFSFWNFG